MELNTFIINIASQYEEADTSVFSKDTKFKEINEWSSLIALSIIAVIDEEYNVKLKGNDIKAASSIEDLFNIVKSKN